MRKKYRSNYRGTRRGIGFLIPTLVVLCIAAAAVLYFVNNNMTYTEDGSYFSLPDKKKKETKETTSVNIVVEDENGEAEKEIVGGAEKDTEKTPVTPEITEVRAHFIGIDSVKSAELLASELTALEGKGYNTVALEVKADDGRLAFDPENPMSDKAGLTGDDAVLSSAIEKVRASGFKVALYMSCFKDNETAWKNQECAVRGQRYIVYDAENMRWLSPYSAEARAYLTGIVKKLSGFGPDEIILSNVSFPLITQSGITVYDTTLGTKDDMLKAFISDALKASGGVELSAVYGNYNSRVLDISGQSISTFGSAFSKLYVDRNAGYYTRALDDLMPEIDGKAYKIVPVIQSVNDIPEYMVKK